MRFHENTAGRFPGEDRPGAGLGGLPKLGRTPRSQEEKPAAVQCLSGKQAPRKLLQTSPQGQGAGEGSPPLLVTTACVPA